MLSAVDFERDARRLERLVIRHMCVGLIAPQWRETEPWTERLYKFADGYTGILTKECVRLCFIAWCARIEPRTPGIEALLEQHAAR